ncbi:K+ channel tetramerization domain-containing protein [Besnoitia besnoiti]|uniref:K+ channel tetramerization domain-containing protein n=1 Tax=Besnoitia besnoiti TaxID=94643 RepID=A0A2A9ML73_BESBE|nr:K+ channel tetramerization domain-containing protein [Besnoitia besnoiti]PFH36377.1 K+ channel tetramerization domain-containing protein [Besnoitia besnoiti]
MEGVSDSSSPPCSFSRCLGASSLSVEACAPPTQAARSKPVNLQTSASSCLPAHKSVDRVVLNVGGRIHETTAETLLSIPESYFSGLLSEGWRAANKACGRDDTIFVDRNGDRFAYVLDFLRDGVLLCPRDKLLLQGLRLEAKFFALEPLLSEVDRLLEQIELEQAARALRKMSVSERSCGGGQGSSAAEGSTSGFSRFSSPAKSRCIPGDGVSEPDSPPVVSVFVPPTPVVLPMHTASVFRAPKDFVSSRCDLGGLHSAIHSLLSRQQPRGRVGAGAPRGL